MAFWTDLGTGGRAAVLALLGVAGIGGAYLWSQRGAEAPVPAPVVSEAAPAATPEAAPPVAPEAAPPVAPVTEATAAPETVEPAAPTLPSFDSWRVEADGAAVVAGLAEPSSIVRVMVDGGAVAEATASPSGQFATLFTLPANDQPSLMSLESILADGTVLVSEATIALEAIPGLPEAEVAAIVPEAVPAATEEAEVAAAVPEDPPPVATEAATDAPALIEPSQDVATAPAEDATAAPVATAPAAILVTEEGARVLQPKVAPDPVVVANVSLDAITYTSLGAVQLGGRGEPGQFVRIYVDNTPLVTALILDEGGWFSTLPEIAPGVYTLRVDQIDTAGTVTSRIETPFLRETREALAAALTPPPAVAVPAEEVAAEAAPLPEPVADPEPAPEVVADPAVAAVAVPEVVPAPQDVAVAEEPVAPAEPQAAPEAAPLAAETAPVAVPEPVVSDAPAEALQPLTVPEPAPRATTEVAPVADTASPQPLPAAEAEAPVAVRQVSITVQPGFTLWGIAEKEFGEGVLYVQVFEANKDKIRDPDLIYPGQVFTVPAGD